MVASAPLVECSVRPRLRRLPSLLYDSTLSPTYLCSSAILSTLVLPLCSHLHRLAYRSPLVREKRIGDNGEAERRALWMHLTLGFKGEAVLFRNEVMWVTG